MPVQLLPGQVVSGTIQAENTELEATGGVLSNPSFTPSDPSAFTCVVDPTNPNNGVIVTALTPATLPDIAFINASATVTDSDGAVNVITGQDTVTILSPVTPPPPPPTQISTTLGFSWGTPSTPASS